MEAEGEMRERKLTREEEVKNTLKKRKRKIKKGEQETGKKNDGINSDDNEGENKKKMKLRKK